MSDFELGQRVRFSTHIRRRHSMPGEFLGPNRIWSTHAGPGMEGKPFKGGEGIVIGKRTLTHGNTTYWGDYSEYTPAATFTAWLVAFDLRRKPVHVLPEHMTALETEPSKKLRTHEHEAWQIRRSAEGGRYCAACGERVA